MRRRRRPAYNEGNTERDAHAVQEVTMARYVVIESRDPVAHRRVRDTYALALELATRAEEVALFLTQDAVLGARRTAPVSGELRGLLESVSVLADDFCLAERGIADDDLLPGVRASGIAAVVDMAVDEGRRVLWN